MDPHVMVRVVPSPPMGPVLGREVRCPCAATWRASTGLSTPEVVQETRVTARSPTVPPLSNERFRDIRGSGH
jgi:hypothetical protein